MKRNKSKIKAWHNKKQTLCWKCKKALGDCPWTKWDEDTMEILFQPVDGWVAQKTSLKTSCKSSKLFSSIVIESHSG